MSIPRAIAAYDKIGNRLFLRDLKSLLFGSESYRMTEKRCREFFEDETNFVGTADAE
jgi:hypothetical protein